MAILPAYKRKLSEYLKELFPLFCAIMQTEIPDTIQLDFFREPVDLRSLSDLRDFLSVILLKGLRRGKRVDRYLKNLLPLTDYPRRLVRERNGHLILKTATYKPWLPSYPALLLFLSLTRKQPYFCFETSSLGDETRRRKTPLRSHLRFAFRRVMVAEPPAPSRTGKYCKNKKAIPSLSYRGSTG